MERKTNVKQILLSSVLFLGLIGVTFYIMFRQQNIKDVLLTIESVNFNWLCMGVVCMFSYMMLDAINVKRLLHLFYKDISYFNCLKYTFAGFFFSSVTPSASGGQPMQVFYMYKDQIEVSQSSLALLLNFASFQLVTIILAIVSFFREYTFLSQIGSLIKLLLFIGIMINSILFIVVLIAIFSKQWSIKIVDFILNIFARFKIQRMEAFRESVYRQIKKYQAGATYIKTHLVKMFSIILTTVIQVIAMHSVTFCIYQAFGLTQFSYVKILCLQAILFIAVSALPLPGAIGVSEGGFVTLFSTLFPQSLIDSAMLLSRGISFYLFVFISGLVVLLAQLILVQRKRRIRKTP